MRPSATGKNQNQQRILQLLRAEEELTKQDIAKRLQLSMPTTLQNVNELLERGILEERGSLASTGGRKARMIGVRRTCGLAIGVNIGLEQVDLVLTDIMGTILQETAVPMIFQDQPEWYRALGEAIEQFVRVHHAEARRLLCAGISFPGIIDMANKQIVRSHIFGVEHVGLERFMRLFSCPVVVANDANSACYAERRTRHADYVYLSLNASVGGAIMVQNRLMLGNTCQTGEIGHMLLIPNGKRCYCGKNGCADAYLSPKALTEGKCSLRDFLQREYTRKKAESLRWEEYLEHLAILVSNLRMLLDMDIVIGGEVGAQIAPYMDRLRKKVEQYDKFARDVNYIYPCSCTEQAFAAGAAMLALEEYSDTVLEQYG